jgi:molecular chaperone HtpG
MTRDELVKNLGTVAHSGSKALLEELAKRGEGSAPTLIGQFGVGFYSAFLVANQVEVTSRAAGSSEAWTWTSDGQSSFTLAPSDRTERGTRIVLHLSETGSEFLAAWRLRETVKRSSNYIGYPIELEVEKRTTEGGPLEKVWERINEAKALWQRPKSSITNEEYEAFFHEVGGGNGKPLAWSHFKVEGTTEFAGLLYLPSERPFDFSFDGKQRGLKLFVKRVLIFDDCAELGAPWARFVRGVLDSDDLPLNVSRELLQDSSVARTIKKQVTKKVLDLLEETATAKPREYEAFFQAFGSFIKEGAANDYEHRERLAKLLRLRSTFTAEGADSAWVSLPEYVSRMREGQSAIYYLVGDKASAVASSPHLEALKKRGFEVLLLTEPVDGFVFEGLGTFDGKELVSALHADLELEASEDEKKAHEEAEASVKTLLERASGILVGKVESVVASQRLTDSPACLVLGEGGLPAHLERMLREAGQPVPPQKRILEVNPSHALVKAIQTLDTKEPGSDRVREYIEVLFDQAALQQGATLEDPNRFAKRVTELLTRAAESAAAS